MSFHDVRFPLDISYGSVGGPGWHSNIITTDSGIDEVVQRWSRPRRTWDVRYGIRSYAAMQSVRNFYVANGGPANSWRFRDPADYSTNASATSDFYQNSASVPPASTDVLLGTGDAAATTFQLRKGYTTGAFTVYVPINKPTSGSTVVSLNDVTQGSGWTVNLTTGIVTFTSAPGAGVNVKAGCEFDVEARFGQELDQMLPIQADSFSSGAIASIPIIEVVDGSTVNEDWLPGGGGRFAFNASATLVQSQGKVWQLSPASAGLTLTIEDAAVMESGGDHYSFENIGSDTITLKGGATTITTLAAGASCRMVIYLVGSTKTWKALA
jgi:uncharacterized protein (TIGR02217 family)